MQTFNFFFVTAKRLQYRPSSVCMCIPKFPVVSSQQVQSCSLTRSNDTHVRLTGNPNNWQQPAQLADAGRQIDSDLQREDGAVRLWLSFVFRLLKAKKQTKRDEIMAKMRGCFSAAWLLVYAV